MSRLPDGRYIDDAAFDPEANIQRMDRRDLDAPNWVLIWRKFRQHKLGLISGIFLLFSYLMLPFAGFIAPYTPNERSSDYLYAPPQSVHLFHEGRVCRTLSSIRSPPRRIWKRSSGNSWPDTSRPMKLKFLCRAIEYNLAGLIPTDRHLFCAPEGATVFLWGSDRLGRDVFSRILYGAQLSLTVGLIGISVSFVLGIVFGSIAGYFGGMIDWVINRVIEILRGHCQNCLYGWRCRPQCRPTGGRLRCSSSSRSSSAFSTGPGWRGRFAPSSCPCAKRNTCAPQR